MPYETPIDILHDLGEGLCEIITKEVLRTAKRFKSDLFHPNASNTTLEELLSEVVLSSKYSKIKNCRNGSDKLHFFRIQLFLAALCSPNLPTKGRFMLQKALRREVRQRAAQDTVSMSLKKFLQATPEMLPSATRWSNEIKRIKNEDVIIADENAIYYGTLHMACGKFKSAYLDDETVDDVMFAVYNNNLEVFRFIAVVYHSNCAEVVVELIKEVEPGSQFASLAKSINDLHDTDYYYGNEILKMLKEYKGVKNGELTGIRLIISIDCIRHCACYIPTHNGILIVAANGALVHN
ncbi:unnamed protein product [Caenorhabditis bovis]|uniref:Uncharacterized protein n=1 Tax=Caenorhabditis bovis TaxID=2654633 RepID=A0A8S1FE82_9PELO|nr:unnamed protein product [Caenorhabditis bovis]